MNRERIIAQVIEERVLQDYEHGGSKHDDELGLADWIVIGTRHLGLACGDEAVIDPERFRKQMIRVAAVAVAAVEALDRRCGKEYEVGALPIGKGW